MDKMAGIMDGLRKQPLTEIAGSAVVKVTDYEKPEETGLGVRAIVPLALIVALCIVFFFAPEQSNQAS